MGICEIEIRESGYSEYLKETKLDSKYEKDLEDFISSET